MAPERKTTVHLYPIDEARVSALVRTGVVDSTAEAIRQGLRALTLRAGLEREVIGVDVIRDSRAAIVAAARFSPAT